MSDEQMIAYSRYEQIAKENLWLMEKVNNMEIWEKKYLEHIDSLVATNKKYELRHAEQRKRIAELEEANGRLTELVQECRKEINKLRDPDLAQYQEQAAQLWNDSCTSGRKSK